MTTTDSQAALTPMMLQWQECKNKAKEALLLFRLGDFYEAFFEDALLLSKELDLTLTQRSNIPMSGIPAHTLESYLEKLILGGYLIAIAEQLEAPQPGKSLVRREITRVISPGIALNPSLLKEKSASYFASIARVNNTYGLTLADFSTGELATWEFNEWALLQEELIRREPKEILISEKLLPTLQVSLEELKHSLSFRLSCTSDHRFAHRFSHDWLLRHFKVITLDGFGLKGMVAGINATGALLSYVHEERSLSLEMMQSMRTLKGNHFLQIDRVTERHLELFHTSGVSFFDSIDETLTPMGGRLLKEWLHHPLMNVYFIHKRQASIEEWLQNPERLQKCREYLRQIKDLERLVVRIASSHAVAKECLILKYSLASLPFLFEILSPLQSCQESIGEFLNLVSLTSSIELYLEESPLLKLNESPLIRKGVCLQLDELREFAKHADAWLQSYQNSLRESLNIKTLKVGYSRGFGYYIEVPRGQAVKVPSTFHKTQTLVNNERFITEELRSYQERMLTNESAMNQRETELYEEIRQKILQEEKKIRAVAKTIANLDCLTALALIAQERNYCKPFIDESQHLNISHGKHPVLQKVMPQGSLIPNDLSLSGNPYKLMIITGPNMAGKSTYLRQVALLVILAQMGSFIPAESAHIGIIDRIFSRIGAQDDLARGQSTFMVEMTETATILHNATSRSLLILDEIGRGTSTYDGIAISWSVAEYLLRHMDTPKTLFATHFFELTELEKKFPTSVNFHIAVEEQNNNITFLRKIRLGSAEKSYGIHVAKLAGMPHAVIKRAQECLEEFEKEKKVPSHQKLPVRKTSLNEQQLLLFPLSSSGESIYEEIHQTLSKLKIEVTTPLEALNLLSKWKKNFPEVV